MKSCPLRRQLKMREEEGLRSGHWYARTLLDWLEFFNPKKKRRQKTNPPAKRAGARIVVQFYGEFPTQLEPLGSKKTSFAHVIVSDSTLSVALPPVGDPDRPLFCLSFHTVWSFQRQKESIGTMRKARFVFTFTVAYTVPQKHILQTSTILHYGASNS